MEYLLPILFIFISFIYSSVGLGGGSSYTALMAILGISYMVIPITSLTLNLVVTFFGMINFWRKGHGRLNLIGPFLVTSIPMAYLAGSLVIPETIFKIILISILLLVAVRIFIINELTFSFKLSSGQKWIMIIALGSVLGFIAGTVGIGGGIYLVPLIIMSGLGSAKEAAATGAMFIWINSLVGFIARFQRETFDSDFILPLIGAVIIGGGTGSYFGSVFYDAKTIQKVMGSILIVAIIFLIQGLI